MFDRQVFLSAGLGPSLLQKWERNVETVLLCPTTVLKARQAASVPFQVQFEWFLN